MNTVYRVVWDDVRGRWVVTSELVRSRSKSGRRSSSRFIARRFGVLALAFQAAAAELPTDGTIVSGAGTISSNGNAMTVEQAGQRLDIDWQSFSIGQGHSVTFVQPDSRAIAFNRVVGADVSRIQGALNANGQVFLANPNGIVFSPTAQVNVGGLLATTLQMSERDGQYLLSGPSNASVIQQGRITANGGGTVALIAARIINSGEISAAAGNVLFGAGNSVTLDLGGAVKIRVEAGALNALIEQGGAIRADGGVVYLTAKAADNLSAAAINHTGLTQARTMTANQRGEIVLLSDMELGTTRVAGTLDASAPNGGDGGFIETSAATVRIGDAVHVTTAAADGNAGLWLIDPTDFTVAASGGDMTGAQVTQALSLGNFTIQTSATHAAGEFGDLFINDSVSWSNNTLTLFAHRNIEINAPLDGSASAGLFLQYGQAASAAGNTANYLVNAPISLASTGSFRTQLGHDGAPLAYTIITSLGAEGSTSGIDLQGINGDLTGRYVLGADIDAAATAAWNGGAGFRPLGSGSAFAGTFDGLGHRIDDLYIDRGDYVGLFSSASSSVIRNLGLVGGSIAGDRYVGALAGSVDGNTTISNVNSSTAVMGGQGVGGLIGQGSFLIITGASATGSVSGVSMVGGLAGTVSDSTITDAHAAGSITGAGSYVGGLLGHNETSTITRAHATGTVSSTGLYVGGLSGYSNESTITDAHATGAVAGIAVVGGLLGLNWDGVITDVYATGSVSGSNFNVGGLMGLHDGTLSRAYATGAVTGGYSVGGLLGEHYAGSTTDVYATGTASGLDDVGGLIGVHVDGVLANAHAIGAVSGASDVGGMIGVHVDGSISNAYWATDSSGHDSSAGGDGMSVAQLMMALPAGFDSNVWGNAGDQATPYLRALTGNRVYTVNDTAQLYTIIQTLDELQAIENDLTGRYALGNSIDASATVTWNGGAGFRPIGAGPLSSGPPSSRYFSGTLDGLDHHIDGLSINQPDEYFLGLFGSADGSATIRNLGMHGGSVAGYGYVGTIAGANAGTISRVYASTTVLGDFYVGALIGENRGAIAYSHASGAASGDSAVGGLVGHNFGTITHSYATGAISSTTSLSADVGGLVGHNLGTITNSYASGSVSGHHFLGGLVGSNYGAVSNSYAAGAVSGSGTFVGGLMGYFDGVGGPSASLTDAYATGSVSGDREVGGLIGGTNGGTIIRVYATGSVSGNEYVGGLIGVNPFATSTAHAYWATDSTGQSSSAIGEGRTLHELMQLSTFGAWDTNIDAQGGTGSIWRIYEGHTTPLLRDFLTTFTATTGDAIKTYDGLAWSGGTGISYATPPSSHLLGTAEYVGASQGARNAGSYAIGIGGLYSHQQGYDITTIDGTLTIERAALTLSAVTDAKVYDGTTASGGGVDIQGLVAGDAVTRLTQSFNGPDVGDRILSVDGSYVIDDGNGGNNYVVTTRTASGAIHAAPSPDADPPSDPPSIPPLVPAETPDPMRAAITDAQLLDERVPAAAPVHRIVIKGDGIRLP